ncbi:hypothetical protein KY325_01025 [Candidatus Woesearchaeota archaeon]|nr:hypothetical protein [Candidatus Woesearchaeota archaeon]
MKKILFALLIVSLLVLSACAGEKVVKEEPAAEPVVEKEVTPAVEEEKKPVVVESCMESSVRELLDKAEKLDPLRYYMRETPYFREQYEALVRANKMKVILPEPSTFVRGEYFNTVYLDLDKKEAVAYCEDRKRCNDFEKQFDVDYDDYYRLTPVDWAMSLKCAKVLGTETMFSRDVALVEYEKNGKTSNMWLYIYNGVTAKMVEDVDAKEPVQRSFEMLSMSVSEKDVAHQSLI